jgi:hypothetical protein
MNDNKSPQLESISNLKFITASHQPYIQNSESAALTAINVEMNNPGTTFSVAELTVGLFVTTGEPVVVGVEQIGKVGVNPQRVDADAHSPVFDRCPSKLHPPSLVARPRASHTFQKVQPKLERT